MPRSRPLRLEPEWNARFSRMVGVSAVAHLVAVVVLIALVLRSGGSSPPLVAYTVELTDPSALGGRLPPGPPGPVFSGGPQEAPAPEPKGVPAGAEPAATPETAAVEPPPQVKPAEPPPAAKPPEPQPKPPEAVAAPPEPKPEPKPEAVAAKPEPPKAVVPKVEPPKPEPPKPEPAKAEPKPEIAKAEPPKPAPAAPARAEPPKAAAPKAEARPVPEARAEAKPSTAPPAPAAKPGSPTGSEEAPPHDAYAAAAERWRAKSSGLGGTDAGAGALGSGGGPGGGGQLVGVEFLAYRQQVINTIRAQWTNVIATAGLLASVRFEIGADGAVSGVRLEQSSGNAAYDASALRAVQRTTQLPPPPARYAKDFREFVMEFHSEDKGGQGAG